MKKVGIVGMGILSAIGQNVPQYTISLRNGISSFSKLQQNVEKKISIDICAKIDGYSFLRELEKKTQSELLIQKAKRAAGRSPYSIQLSVGSALEAWEDALLSKNEIPSERIGIIIAGQNTTFAYQCEACSTFKKNPVFLSPRYALQFLETNQVGVLSEIFNINGEGFVVGGASASGNVAVIKAYQLLQTGIIDACVVVGTAADLTPMDMQGFYNIGAMGGRKFHDQPQKACRPFDKEHEGFIYGQASAALVMETFESASIRGVPILTEIKGGALNLDGGSSSEPNINGESMAMATALKRSGTNLDEIDYINTHGSSSPLGDRTELEAIKLVFDKYKRKPYLNSTKGLTGHCLYSAGIVEIIATVIQMRDGFLHPNKNLENPISDEFLFCGDSAIDIKIKNALSNSFGFGGINSSIVLSNEFKN